MIDNYQVEGLGTNENNNWKQWTKEQVCEWMKNTLSKNNFYFR